MKAGSFFKRTFKPFVDVPRWMGLKQLINTTKDLKEMAKDIFTPETATHEETFEDALKRLNLTEEDLIRKRKTFILLTIFWLVISILVLTYGVYIAGQGSWRGLLACVGVAAIGLAQAFRYHFWLFQLKQRRLGCTLREWYEAYFSSKGGTQP